MSPSVPVLPSNSYLIYSALYSVASPFLFFKLSMLILNVFYKLIAVWHNVVAKHIVPLFRSFYWNGFWLADVAVSYCIVCNSESHCRIFGEVLFFSFLHAEFVAFLCFFISWTLCRRTDPCKATTFALDVAVNLSFCPCVHTCMVRFMAFSTCHDVMCFGTISSFRTIFERYVYSFYFAWCPYVFWGS